MNRLECTKKIGALILILDVLRSTPVVANPLEGQWEVLEIWTLLKNGGYQATPFDPGFSLKILPNKMVLGTRSRQKHSRILKMEDALERKSLTAGEASFAQRGTIVTESLNGETKVFYKRRSDDLVLEFPHSFKPETNWS